MITKSEQNCGCVDYQIYNGSQWVDYLLGLDCSKCYPNLMRGELKNRGLYVGGLLLVI
jgi:hypothetical protein